MPERRVAELFEEIIVEKISKYNENSELTGPSSSAKLKEKKLEDKRHKINKKIKNYLAETKM